MSFATHDETADLDATALAALVREGDATPRELADLAIARIEVLNPELNAVIHPRFERALEEADLVDADAPFAGVPMLVKDCLSPIAGEPYHLGMRALRDAGHRADHDGELTRRFRAGGLVMLGRTNTPELAAAPTCEPLAYGPTRNPWNTEHSTGGSSGGSAAAVASGMVPVAHGNDMGGSIRIPSSECGLVGLKPTRARTSLAPDFGEFWGSLTHEFVLVRSVRDAAGMLDALAGPSPGDPYTAPAPRRPWREEVGADPGRLRMGVLTSRADGAPVHPECVAAAERAAALLAALGHDVDDSWPEAVADLDARATLGTVVAAALAYDLDRWSAVLGRTLGRDDVEPATWVLAERGRALSATELVDATERGQRLSRRIAAWWADGHDVLITPTLAVPPPRLGEIAPTVPFEDLLPKLSAVGAFVGPWNLTGQPAMSLPLHTSADGLPIGVQLVAAYGREDVLLRVAAQLEQATPWAHARPPVHANAR